MDKREEILLKEFDVQSEDCRTWAEDIQLALVLNPDLSKIKNAMDEYAAEWKNKYEEANQFICDLGKLIGLDGLGYDDLKASIEDFRDAIDEKKKEFCLQLLEYMAKNKVVCGVYSSASGELFKINGRYLTGEQLFENFL